MKQYSAQELSECPKIILEGKEYPIPMFGPRQNRRIVPLIGQLRGVTIDKLDTSKMDALYNSIFWALSRAHEIKEADFQDMNIPVGEALKAMVVISKQTGLMDIEGAKPAVTVAELVGILTKYSDQKAKVTYTIEGEDSKTGEEEATAKSTGISSSPESSLEQD